MEKEKLFYEMGYRVSVEGQTISHKGNEVGFMRAGYLHAGTTIKGRVIKCPIHRLQAYQKYGDLIYENAIEVRHLNGNKIDNSWDNIAIGTHSNNMMDIPEHIRIANALHATSFVRKYDRREVLEFYNTCKSYKKTMEQFSISSKGTLHFILRGRSSVGRASVD